MYKLFLCLRYLRKRRIAFFAVGAVCLCVAMVLIVVSVMGGFLQMVKDRSRGMLGDLVMENGALQGFPFYQEFIDQIKTEMPDAIVEATPVIVSYGVLRFPSDQITKAVQIVGIRLDETYRVNEFRNGLYYEKYYPGTTTLGPWREPHYGQNERREFVLPPELESARRKWESTATPEEIYDAWTDRLPVFDMDDERTSAELDKGRLPVAVRDRLVQEMISLSDDATVDAIDPGRAWTVNQRGGTLAIERNGKKLEVYLGQYTGPGIHRRVPAELEPSSEPAEPPADVATDDAPASEDSSSGFISLKPSPPAWVGDELPGIVIGTDLCADRTPRGDYTRYYSRGYVVHLLVVPFRESGKPTDATGFKTKPFRYVDDSRTGVYDIDSMSVYADFAVVQNILDMAAMPDADPPQPARTTQIQIKLASGVDPIAARDAIDRKWKKFYAPRIDSVMAPELLHRVRVLTWEQKQERFIAAVEKEKYLVTILFGVISVVAVLLVGCIFYMIVQQKTRDIGIIKSVGATSLGVAGIFITYGAAVGIVGGAIGLALGALFVRYINEVQDLLAWLHPGWVIWDPSIYTFDRIPSDVKALDVIIIYVIAILASVTGSLIAARSAARVWPVEALRYE